MQYAVAWNSSAYMLWNNSVGSLNTCRNTQKMEHTSVPIISVIYSNQLIASWLPEEHILVLCQSSEHAYTRTDTYWSSVSWASHSWYMIALLELVSVLIYMKPLHTADTWQLHSTLTANCIHMYEHQHHVVMIMYSSISTSLSNHHNILHFINFVRMYCSEWFVIRYRCIRRLYIAYITRSAGEWLLGC